MIARLLAAPLLFLAGLPALAQTPNPSPCDYVVATGAPLPRQNTVRAGTSLTNEPNPTWRSKYTARVLEGEPVTVLQECGYRLRVRTVRGDEGWVATAMLPAELRLMEIAKNRPPATEEECRRRFLDERLARRCQGELAERKAHETEVRTAPLLTAEETTAYLSGHTLTLSPRVEDSSDDLKAPPIFFFAADGEVFFREGQGFRWRGRWTFEGDPLCFPNSGVGCVRFRKLPDGRLLWVNLADKKEYFIARTDGPAAGLIPYVSESYPNPVPPPAPKGSEPFARPSLGGL